VGKANLQFYQVNVRPISIVHKNTTAKKFGNLPANPDKQKMVNKRFVCALHFVIVGTGAKAIQLGWVRSNPQILYK